MKSVFSCLLSLTAFLLLSSCTAEGEYSTWPCRFGYDNSLHLDPTLSSAMSPDVRGVFCRIWESTNGGRYLNFQSNQSSQVTSQIESDMERMAGFVLGLNNGIIVGF